MKRLVQLALLSLLLISITTTTEAEGWRFWKRSKQKTVEMQAQKGAAVAAPRIGTERKSPQGDGIDSVLKGKPGPVPAGRPTEVPMHRGGSTSIDLRRLPYRKPVEKTRFSHEKVQPNPVEIDRGLVEEPNVVQVEPTQNVIAPAPTLTFDGLDREFWGAGSPPDTTGDVGPDYFIQAVNTSVGIYRKSDGVQEAAFTFDTLMSQGSFGNQCDTENFGDPIVLYDTFEDRWILTDFAFTLDGGGSINPPEAFQCFAVSMNGNPLTGGWNFYSIKLTDALNDYPKLGVWTDGIYMSANLFGFPAGSSYQGTRVWALNKAQMYAGAPTVQVVSFDVGTGDFTLLPSNARLQTGTPPAGTPNYFVSTWNFLNALTVYKFSVNWNQISLSTFTGPDTPLAATSWPNATVANVPQSGTANLLDALQIRNMMQNQYTNIGGVESLWNTHTVRRGNTSGFAAPRWYQVDVTGGTVNPAIPQAATWDPDAANVLHRWMPSLAIDRAGNMALGYSTSSSTTFPSISYAGRLSTDPVNTFSLTEQNLFTGSFSQTTSTRWGDYSTMTLDPDGCRFWYTTEYANSDQNFDKRWRTRIATFVYPECTPVGAGGTLTGTVTLTPGGTPISGATIQFGARTATTNGSGVYSFTGTPAGSYPSMSATKAGFSTASAAPISIIDGGTTTQDFALTAAPASACLTDTTQADFQAGVFTPSLDVITTPGDVSLVNLVLDQSNSAGTTTGTGFGTPAWAGQTFIPAVTGALERADVRLFCNGCGVTPPNLTLSVRATSGGLPTGADLASTTILGSLFASGASVTATASFGAPAALTAGTQYALILRPVSAPAGSGYFWIRSSPSTYASGSRVLSADSGGSWSADTARDFNFWLYMRGSYAPSGNIVSGLNDSNPSAGLTPIWSTLSWNATAPANTTLRFQVAGSNSEFGPFAFVGPDGTAATFYTTSPGDISQFYGLRYLQYKAYLDSTDTAVTPTLNDVTACFANTDCSGAATVTPTPAQVCPGSTGNTADGPAGATSYSWSITGGSITAGQTSQQVTYTAGASGSVVLTLDVVEAAGCHKTGTSTITINPIPATPSITPGGPTTFCPGGSVTLDSGVASGNQWYLDGNPIGGATSQTYNATASGDYTVVVTSLGCSSAPSSATTVTVTPTPATPTISAGGPTTFCSGGSVTLDSGVASGNQWSLNGNPIGGATSQTYVASAAGDYTVVVTTSGCPSLPSAATTVTVNPLPSTAITAPGSVLQNTGGHTASVPDAGVGATYAWLISGGTITSATNTRSITFSAGASPGPVQLDVTVTSPAPASCPNNGTTNVTVSALPTVTVTSVTPNNGSMLGGTAVTIAGTNFASGAAVTFDGLAATSVVFVNSTQITARTPAHAVGAVNVVVTNTDTSSGSLTNGYTYVTRQFDPNGDTNVDPSDIFYLVNYLYSGGPAPAGTSGMASGDANGDGVVDPADIFYTVNYLFLGGPVPYVTTPQGAKPETAGGRFEGSISLGQARAKNGRLVVPVIVTMKPGSILPRALSLDVRVDGGATIAGAHRVAGVETAFEISRKRGQGIAYLASFSDASPLRLDQYGSVTIAELELGSALPSRLEIDPALTMLVDAGGSRKATAKDGTLKLEGVDVGGGQAPKTKLQAQ